MAVRPRDELGWRVPRPGTTSAVIYALARQGLSTGEIAKELGRGYQTVAVLVFKIKHPERGNQLGNARREKRPNAPYERKPITAEETHARKVARVLRLPLDQARALVRGERFRTAASAEPEPSAVASIVGGERPTTIIVSTPKSNDCRRYQLNVDTGTRNDQGPVNCNADSSNQPGQLEAISKAFRNH